MDSKELKGWGAAIKVDPGTFGGVELSALPNSKQRVKSFLMDHTPKAQPLKWLDFHRCDLSLPTERYVLSTVYSGLCANCHKGF